MHCWAVPVDPGSLVALQPSHPACCTSARTFGSLGSGIQRNEPVMHCWAVPVDPSSLVVPSLQLSHPACCTSARTFGSLGSSIQRSEPVMRCWAVPVDPSLCLVCISPKLCSSCRPLQLPPDGYVPFMPSFGSHWKCRGSFAVSSNLWAFVPLQHSLLLWSCYAIRNGLNLFSFLTFRTSSIEDRGCIRAQACCSGFLQSEASLFGHKSCRYVVLSCLLWPHL